MTTIWHDDQGRPYSYDSTTGETKWVDPSTVVSSKRASQGDSVRILTSQGSAFQSKRGVRSSFRSGREQRQLMAAIRDEYADIAGQLVDGLKAQLFKPSKKKGHAVAAPPAFASYATSLPAPLMASTGASGHNLVGAAAPAAGAAAPLAPPLMMKPALSPIKKPTVVLSPLPTYSTSQFGTDSSAESSPQRSYASAAGWDTVEYPMALAVAETAPGNTADAPAPTQPVAAPAPADPQRRLVKQYRKQKESELRRMFVSSLSIDELRLLYEGVPDFVQPVLVYEMTEAQRIAFYGSYGEVYNPSPIPGQDVIATAFDAQLDDYGGYYAADGHYMLYNPELAQYQAYDWEKACFIDTQAGEAAGGPDQGCGDVEEPLSAPHATPVEEAFEFRTIPAQDDSDSQTVWSQANYVASQESLPEHDSPHKSPDPVVASDQSGGSGSLSAVVGLARLEISPVRPSGEGLPLSLDSAGWQSRRLVSRGNSLGQLPLGGSSRNVLQLSPMKHVSTNSLSSLAPLQPVLGQPVGIVRTGSKKMLAPLKSVRTLELERQPLDGVLHLPPAYDKSIYGNSRSLRQAKCLC